MNNSFLFKALSVVSLLLLVPNFTTCQESTKKQFVINIEVQGGEGKEMSLVYKLKGEEVVVHSKVNNGGLVFKGELDQVQEAQILFRYAYDEPQSIYSSQTLILEFDTITAAASVESQEFGGQEIWELRTEGFKSKYNDKLEEVYMLYEDSLTSYMIRPDQEYMDSLARTLFVDQRGVYISMLEKLTEEPEFSILALIFFRDLLEDNFAFEARYVRNFKRERWFRLLEAMPKGYRSLPIYRNIIDDLTKLEQGSKFDLKDFEIELKSLNGERVLLNEIVEANKFTVLYFWHAGCGPCRLFNSKHSTIYPKLDLEGIAFIGVSTDSFESHWNFASKEDKISWPNLLALDTKQVTDVFNISAYPKKVVLDENGNQVDFYFSKMTQLKKLTKQ